MRPSRPHPTLPQEGGGILSGGQVLAYRSIGAAIRLPHSVQEPS